MLSQRNHCNHYNRLVVILLTAAYLLETKASPLTNNKFQCPQTESCSCTLDDNRTNDHEIQCPPINPDIIVRVQPQEYISIDCANNTMNETKYTLLPNMNIGDIVKVQIRRCPLPTGTSIHAILERLGIKRTRSLWFRSYGELCNPLNRQHFTGFKELERLVLSGNGLSDLPEDLFNDVANIIWLDLRSNKVHLPRDIFLPLEKLEYLELGHNDLERLEDGIFRNQKRLKQLNIWGNKLKNLTKESFEGVGSISDLDLSSNGIEELQSDVFKHLVNLSNINLNQNNFESLPEGLFSENKKLTRLRLMDNRFKLKTLPNGFLANLPELEEVRIHCHLISVPDSLFSRSFAIRNISLADNDLEQIPEHLLANQTNLLDLDLSNNKLIDLPDYLFSNTRSLIVLKLSYNYLTNISSDLFNGLKVLQELHLNNNQLHNIHHSGLASMKNLRFIQLENNRLSFHGTLTESSDLQFPSLSDNVSPFQNLEMLLSLKLRNNSITSVLSDWFINNIFLNDLDLSYNNITMIGASDFSFLSRVNMSINLTHNAIQEVDLRDIEIYAAQNDGERKGGIDVHLDHNPIDCNCILLNFVRFLRREELNKNVYNLLRIHANDLRCSSPDNLKGTLAKKLHPMELLCPLDAVSTSIKRCPPECNNECWVRPADRALIVNCSNVGLTKIPKLPRPSALGLSFIQLHVENNSLYKLPRNDTPGYNESREIYARNNNITALNEDDLLENLRVLDLSNNHLMWINGSVFDTINKSKSLQNITLGLGGNPWLCDCNALPLLAYAQTNYRKITDFQRMECSTGEKFSVISPGDLCSDDERFVVTGVLIAFFGIATGILAALYYKYQQEVKVWLFAHNMCLWFVTEEELDKDKKYDAFISYSHKDEDFITEHLVPTLESGSTPFKLCLHIRDWIVGEYIPNQITNSVEESRRTVVVLSPNFLESVWGRMEFRAAHTAALSEGRARVIVVIYGDIGDTSCLDPELKAYLNMNTYVKWGDPWFWDKLRYAMPHPSSVERNHRQMTTSTIGLVKTSIKSSVDDKLELIKPQPVTPPLTTPPAEQAGKNPLVTQLNGEIRSNNSHHHQSQQLTPNSTPNSKIANGVAGSGAVGTNGHVNGAFIINTNAKQSDV